MSKEFVSPKLVAIAAEDPGRSIEGALRALESNLSGFEAWGENHRREQEELHRRIWNDAQAQPETEDA